MQQISVTAQAAREIPEDPLTGSFVEFKMTLDENNIMFENVMANMDIRKNCGVLRLKLQSQRMMDDVITFLADTFQLKILYVYHSLDGGHYQKALLYSFPRLNQMYVIGIESHQYGIVEEVVVTFYSSLDVMFRHLKSSFDYLSRQKVKILGSQTLPELYSVFV